MKSVMLSIYVRLESLHESKNRVKELMVNYDEIVGYITEILSIVEG